MHYLAITQRKYIADQKIRLEKTLQNIHTNFVPLKWPALPSNTRLTIIRSFSTLSDKPTKNNNNKHFIKYFVSFLTFKGFVCFKNWPCITNR